jgi:hypothetical protein
VLIRIPTLSIYLCPAVQRRASQASERASHAATPVGSPWMQRPRKVLCDVALFLFVKKNPEKTQKAIQLFFKPETT